MRGLFDYLIFGGLVVIVFALWGVLSAFAVMFLVWLYRKLGL